jgi:hypothetical protein
VITLRLPNDLFHTGDTFQLDLDIDNPGPPVAADLYVLLQVFSEFWFYPSWRPLDEGLDFQAVTYDTGQSTMSIIPPFTLPDVSPGGPFYFHTASFEPGALDLDHLVAAVDSVEFRFE